MRAQLSHCLFDCDMSDKPKIKALRLRFGHIARLWLIDMLSDMSRATNATIDIDLALGHAQELGIENASELVDYCLSKDILAAENPGTLTNTRVIEDQEKLFVQREKWRESKGVAKKIPKGIQREASECLNVQKSEHCTLNTEDLDLKKVVRLAPSPESSEIPRVRGGFPAKTDEFPPESAQFVDACREQLHPPDSPNIENDSRFINCGRRPMRKYPEIWLTLHDLVEARRQLDDAGIPPDKLWMVFSKVAAKLRTKIESGESVFNINPFLWLIGWAKKEALDELKSSLDLERSQNYLKKAKG